jgi:hypothetical protein
VSATTKEGEEMNDTSTDTETIATDRELVEIETKARATKVMHWPELVRLINRLRKAEAEIERLWAQWEHFQKLTSEHRDELEAEIERLRKPLKIEVCKGGLGLALYVNNTRIAGPSHNGRMDAVLTGTYALTEKAVR